MKNWFNQDIEGIKQELNTNLEKGLTDEQVKFLDDFVKSRKKENSVVKVDVTALYENEFCKSPNESAYCTPYTLLRLLADLVPNMPDKLLYLDIDMMVHGDIKILYDINVEDYEYAAVKEK